jgi:hypothetical protein
MGALLGRKIGLYPGKPNDLPTGILRAIPALEKFLFRSQHPSKNPHQLTAENPPGKFS